MSQYLAKITLVVKDYDEAIGFFVHKLGFRLLEDTRMSTEKRWVVVSPSGETSCAILLAKAANEEQTSAIGQQTGGRVAFFLHTDNFWRDYEQYLQKGIHFVRAPQKEPYGTVAVFEDLYGNLWDLVEPNSGGIV